MKPSAIPVSATLVKRQASGYDLPDGDVTIEVYHATRYYLKVIRVVDAIPHLLQERSVTITARSFEYAFPALDAYDQELDDWQNRKQQLSRDY